MQSHQRLDIQGLRMVAILTVFANHLWGWPRGGFIGIDVFFVISGFLITGNLLRDAETRGTVSFKRFYWNRVRRIVPAATVVLILTYLASVLVFLPFRANQVGIDALFAFVFMSNWWFASQDTDYFAAADSVSPIQHYWSLSIEEQFYFVWPALIFVISLLVIRKAWPHARRMLLAGAVMGAIVASSLSWALYETAASPTWAYFNTFARIWELGVGALLATAVGVLGRIPDVVKPVLAWAGLVLIAASVVLIADDSVGFPAPWALLPVAGSALVISAGVNGEPKYQGLLRNPASTYIGDISYSLYLVHWPVIVILGSLMDGGVHFSVAAVALSFGLAVASYHFVENPLRRADWGKFRETVHEIRRRRHHPQRSNGYAATAALALLVVASIAYTGRPGAFESSYPPPMAAVAPQEESASGGDTAMPPLTAALQDEIIGALQTTTWPPLEPSMESVIKDRVAIDPELRPCTGLHWPDPQLCTWGAPSAPIRVMLVGNSVAVGYLGPLREIALNSGGQIQLFSSAMAGCTFVTELITTGDPYYLDACPGRKQQTIDFINTTKPDVVIISNTYAQKQIHGTDHEMTFPEYSDSMRKIIETFRGNTGKIVFLAPPPGDLQISDCYGNRSKTPPDCISGVGSFWSELAQVEQDLAASIGATWVDSRPWFCTSMCPSFVGSTPTKFDVAHMVPAYGLKIAPVIDESFRQGGIFPAR